MICGVRVDQPLRRPELLGIALLAALPRLWNLGASSLWLDEILQTRMASGTLWELLEALRNDRVHPPLDGWITWFALQMNVPDMGRRLIPVAFGIVTAVVLARWVSEHFGRPAGWTTGVLASCSPIHVQYSQELRPYSLALLLMCLTLWLFDRELRHGRGRFWAAWMVPATAALYSLYFAVVLFVPLLVLAQWAGSARFRRFVGQCAGIAAAFSPWALAVLTATHRAVEAGASTWTLDRAFQRWHHLTLGGLPGDAPSPMAWWPLGLLAVALLAARGRIATWALFSGALVGTVGIEGLLAAADHWSSPRYSLVAWPFITALIGIGAAELGAWVGRGRRTVTVGLSALAVGICCAGQVEPLQRYYDRGRPNWGWTAENLAAWTQPGGRIVAMNPWTKICLDHHLGPHGLEVIEVSLPDLAPTPGPGCTYLVDGGYPKDPTWRDGFPNASKVAIDAGGLGTQVYRLEPFEPGRPCRWTVARSHAAESQAIEFDALARTHLVRGWANPEHTTDGMSFTWATARDAFVALGSRAEAPETLQLRARSLVDGQVIRLTLGGQSIARFEVGRAWADLTIEVPPELWGPVDNVLGIHSSVLASPQDVDPAARDPRELAVAVDRLELVPAPRE